MKKLLITALIFPLLISGQENVRFSKTINTVDLERHITILSSDSLQGRETGKPGQKIAANYIANHFKSIDIPPCITFKHKYTKQTKTTYFQTFKVKSKRHLCKCDDCDVDFIKDLLGVKRWINGENVLGYIEGTDLKDELILITAHYDHLGTHDTLVFPGADDNASGTAATLEIAKAFMLAKKEGQGP